MMCVCTHTRGSESEWSDEILCCDGLDSVGKVS
jgi:hypothetical protein